MAKQAGPRADDTPDAASFDLGFDPPSPELVANSLIAPAQALSDLHGIVNAEIRRCLAEAQISLSQCRHCVQSAVSLALADAQRVQQAFGDSTRQAYIDLLTNAWTIAAEIGCLPEQVTDEAVTLAGQGLLDTETPISLHPMAMDNSTFPPTVRVGETGPLPSLQSLPSQSIPPGWSAIGPGPHGQIAYAPVGAPIAYELGYIPSDLYQDAITGNPLVYPGVTLPPFGGPQATSTSPAGVTMAQTSASVISQPHEPNGAFWKVGPPIPPQPCGWAEPQGPAGWPKSGWSGIPQMFACYNESRLMPDGSGRITVSGISAVQGTDWLVYLTFAEAGSGANSAYVFPTGPPPAIITLPSDYWVGPFTLSQLAEWPVSPAPQWIPIVRNLPAIPIPSPLPTPLPIPLPITTPPIPQPPTVTPPTVTPPAPRDLTSTCKLLGLPPPILEGTLVPGSARFCEVITETRNQINAFGKSLMGSFFDRPPEGPANAGILPDFVARVLIGPVVIVGEALQAATTAAFDWIKCMIKQAFSAGSSLANCNTETYVGLIFLRTIVSSADHIRVGIDPGLWVTTDLSVDMSTALRVIDYLINWSCPNTIISQSEAIGLYLTNQISIEHCKCLVELNGGIWELAMKQILAQRARPNDFDLVQLYNRQYINDIEYISRMREIGYLDGNEALEKLQLGQQLPGPSDIVRFMLRDTFDESVVDKYGYDDEFEDKFTGKAKDWARGQGVSTDIMRQYWRAHWELPSNTALYEMVRRLRPGRVPEDLQVTQTDALELLGINDVAPGWRRKLLAISYQPMTRIDARRSYDLGILSTAELIDAMQDIGYSIDDANKLTRLADRARHKSIMASKWVKHYLAGGMPRALATDRLESEGYPANSVADAMAEVDIEQAAKSRAECVKAVHHRIAIGEIDRQVALTQLVNLGLDGGQADTLVSAWVCERSAKGKALNAGKICELLENGIITVDDASSAYMRLGYSAIDANRILVSCKRQISNRQAKRALQEQLDLERRMKAEAAKSEKILRRRQQAAVARLKSIEGRARRVGSEMDHRIKALADYGGVSGTDLLTLIETVAPAVQTLVDSQGLSELLAWKSAIETLANSPKGGYPDLVASILASGPAVKEAFKGASRDIGVLPSEQERIIQLETT